MEKSFNFNKIKKLYKVDISKEIEIIKEWYKSNEIGTALSFLDEGKTDEI